MKQLPEKRRWTSGARFGARYCAFVRNVMHRTIIPHAGRFTRITSHDPKYARTVPCFCNW